MVKRSVVVVDLDGTLYDSTARQHLAQNGEWEEFHRRSVDDPPREDVLQFLSVLPLDVKVVACTGRNEAHRAITEDWLILNAVPVDALLMRPEHDYTSDTVVKPTKLLEWAAEEFPGWPLVDLVWVVLEDRDKMVQCWRDMGLTCWQVNTGVF